MSLYKERNYLIYGETQTKKVERVGAQLFFYKYSSISFSNDVGVSFGPKRLTIVPFLSTRNLVKFHLIALPKIPFVSSVSNLMIIPLIGSLN